MTTFLPGILDSLDSGVIAVDVEHRTSHSDGDRHPRACIAEHGSRSRAGGDNG